ncbi:MAG: hypothetical protein CL435_05705 [Acidimicrobiaceae bacterium]|nr:hypothetical protein [Acidimicrobiaceae bacterium]HJO80647.1 phosphatidylserine/phosphatidylglycerophosphate/cardiolipin synthase family protein [Acidimicrobiales bacterium]|tara:strand:- start:7538 stop:8896 length:1359 start_codon:yes stop_codon:yes gene_type:complete
MATGPEDLRAYPASAEGAFPPREGNLVLPLVDGAVAFDLIAEAVEAAVSSVWVCVAFIEVDAIFPHGRGTFLDLMDTATGRGINVRVLFWHPEGEAAEADDTLPGDSSTASLLAARNTTWHARWDAVGMRCQHQKMWLIDAGTSDEVAFVGGINISAGSMAGPDHDEPSRHDRYANIHDVHCLMRGPSVTDVHDNFVMRWNGASQRDQKHGAWPVGGTDDLDSPVGRTALVGDTTAQIVRSVLPGLYPELPNGENSVRAQYLEAIGAARDYIYIEDQILLSRVVLVALGEALERGVVVVALVPGDPMPELARYRAFPGIAAGYDALAALAEHAGFCLAAPAARRSWGYEEIYVHSKTMVVDDRWATIGSANLIFTSFQGDTEMNVSFWDAEVARSFRVRQIDEQGGFASAGMDGRAAVQGLAEVAQSNNVRRAHGGDLVGFACRIDPSSWAT